MKYEDSCIICLENKCYYYFPKYYNNCKCLYSVHKYCIEKWNHKNNYCIICRTEYNKLYLFNTRFSFCIFPLFSFF